MTEATTQSPGQRLIAAREGMEVSPREIADALNLPLRVIECLESDDYEELPPTVFTRGYLRSYAKLLELPADELLADYPEVESDVVSGILEAVTPPMPYRLSLQMLGLAAAAVVVLIVGAIWLIGRSAEEPAAVGSSTVAEEAAAETTAEPELTRSETLESSGAQEISEPALRPVLEEIPESIPEQISEPIPEQPTSAELADAEPEVDQSQTDASAQSRIAENEVSVPGRRERRITEFGEDRLLFSFSEDCWVEVKSIDGENLYSDLSRSGYVLVLTGQGPFRILLGYAPGVSLEFNNRAVDLGAHTRNNVATLVLGR